jgi:hypothetical protein
VRCQTVVGLLKAGFKALEPRYRPAFVLYVWISGDLVIGAAQVWWTVMLSCPSAGGVRWLSGIWSSAFGRKLPFAQVEWQLSTL